MPERGAIYRWTVLERPPYIQYNIHASWNCLHPPQPTEAHSAETNTKQMIIYLGGGGSRPPKQVCHSLGGGVEGVLSLAPPPPNHPRLLRPKPWWGLRPLERALDHVAFYQVIDVIGADGYRLS